MPDPLVSKKDAESPAHLEMRHALRRIALSVKDNEGVDEFNLEQLKRLNVRLDPMALDESSPHKPSYFAPYPAHLTPDANEEILGGQYNGIDGEHDLFSLKDPSGRGHAMETHLSHYIHHCITYCKEERAPWNWKCLGNYPYKGLYKMFPPAYKCVDITDLNGSTHPHVKAIMIQGLIPTDTTILRGELFPIVMIMITQFWKARFAHQMVAPVLMISLMGFKARVIEAYFKDQTLVLRPSKMLDFTHANDAGFKTFVQWFLGPPTGDTVEAS